MKRLLGNGVSLKRLLGNVALLFAVSAVSLPSHASLIYEYSFTDRGNGTTVSGQIFGLRADGLDQQAESITIDQVTSSFPPSIFPLTLLPVSVAQNSFDVQAGVVTGVSFISASSTTTVPDTGFGTTLSTFLTLGATDFGTSLRGFYRDTGQSLGIGLRPGDELAITSYSEVPEPSSLALFGAGVIAVGVLRRKKRKLVE